MQGDDRSRAACAASVAFAGLPQTAGPPAPRVIVRAVATTGAGSGADAPPRGAWRDATSAKDCWGAPKGTPRVCARSPGRAIGRDPADLRRGPHQRASVKIRSIGASPTLQAAAAAAGLMLT